MEENQQILPLSESAVKQEEGDSKEGNKYSGILPSMPPDSSQRPAPQDSHSPFAQMQGYAQPPGYVQPLATYPPAEPGGMRAEVGFSSSPPLWHPAYSDASLGTGAYMTLPRLGDSSAAGMPPVQSYPGYASYPYDSSGQGYPYGTSTSMSYSSYGAAGSQSISQILTDSSYPGMAPDQVYGGGAQGHPYYGSGYPPQYQGQPGYGYYGAPGRGQGHQQRSLPKQNKSYATKPGKPYYNDKNRSGPDGANLFVFYIPNDMTNNEMFGLFSRFGSVLSARIMTEEGTGRGKGFGFISYDSPGSAADAIHHLNGYQIRGKRLLVQYKKPDSKAEMHGQGRRRHTPPSGFVMPMHDYSMPPQLNQPEVHQVLPPAGFPTQEYAMPPQPRQHELRRDQPSSDFVPVMQEDAGSSQPYEHEVRRDQPGILPVQEYAGPLNTHRHRGSTPVLPPLGNSSAQINPTSPSPLDDLQGIGNALPDSEEQSGGKMVPF